MISPCFFFEIERVLFSSLESRKHVNPDPTEYLEALSLGWILISLEEPREQIEITSLSKFALWIVHGDNPRKPLSNLWDELLSLYTVLW